MQQIRLMQCLMKRNLIALQEHFKPQNIDVLPISGVTGAGMKELLTQLHKMLQDLPKETL